MTKNRNWQSRVENAVALRQETRHRKQRTDEKRQRRAAVQRLLRQLDKHRQALYQQTSANRIVRKLHIWIDKPSDLESAPNSVLSVDSTLRKSRSFSTGSDNTDKSNVDRTRVEKNRSISLGNENDHIGRSDFASENQNSKGRKGKTRSGSMESETNYDESRTERKIGRRLRSQSTTDVPEPYKVGKKVAFVLSDTMETSATSKMIQQHCLAYFYSGKCCKMSSRGKRKSGGCRMLHPDNTISSSSSSATINTTATTLHDVLSSGNHLQLNRSEKAYSEHLLETNLDIHPGSMEAICHFSLELNDGDESITAQISECFANDGLQLQSIVYVAFDNVLVFDRYREGMIFHNDRDLVHSVLDTEHATIYCRSIGEEEDQSAYTEDHAIAVQSLPTTVLEHILLFLSDETVATFSSVCRAWSQEVGKSSPHLWINLLDRQGWPHPCLTKRTKSLTDLYRDQFLKHYSVVKDLKSVRNALQACVDTESVKARCESKNVAFQTFSARSGAPSFPNVCVGIQIWSPNRVLIAYQDDCSLRLFKSVIKSGSNEDFHCRELVCHSFNPFRHTKKISCHIIAMDLDDKYVGCLCYTEVAASDTDQYQQQFVLVLATRDDYLRGDIEYLIVDLERQILNYFIDQIDCKTNEHPLPEFVDFLLGGGDLKEIHIIADETLCSVGTGRFLVTFDFCVGDSIYFILAVVSAVSGEIIWAHNYDAAHFQNGKITVVRSHSFAEDSTSAFFITSNTSPLILSGIGERSDTLHCLEMLTSSYTFRNDFLGNFWHMLNESDILGNWERPIIVTDSDVIAADLIVKYSVDGTSELERKTVISFFPREPATNSEVLSYHTVLLPENQRVRQMCCIRHEHLVLICERRQILHLDDGNVQGINTVTNMEADDFCIDAVIIHIASRKEIGSVVLRERITRYEGVCPTFASHCDGTLGIDLCCQGVAIVGSDVRSITDALKSPGHDSVCNLKSTTKKKNRKVKDGCKDRFTRGMSLKG